MSRFRRIFTIGMMSVLVTVSTTGCPSTTPVDTSQSILIQIGTSLANIDAAVERGTRANTDGAVDRAVARVEAGECNEGEPRDECVVRFLREEMDMWYRLVAALEAAHGTLETWEGVNDAWRQSGERPSDWDEIVCHPVGTMVQTIMDLLDEAGIDIPPTWRDLITRADELCQIGVIVAETTNGGSR